jgi:DNA-binding Lrp family transcriptional regulator
MSLSLFRKKTKLQVNFGPPHAVFNLSKIGLRYFRIGIEASPSSRENLIRHFKSHPNIGWIFSAEGWFNLAIGIWARDNAEINDISSQIRSVLTDTDKIIFQSELTSLFGFGNRPLTSKGEPMCIVDSTMHPVDLSPLELDYIKLLALDSSTETQELAKILNTSPSELQGIHDHMLKTGVITGFQERINYSGFYFKVFIDSLSRKAEGALPKLIQTLWNDNACIYFEKANSKYDIEFELILDEKSNIKDYVCNFSDYKVAILTENLYTNLYPLNKIANLKEIKDALAHTKGNIVDFRNSKLWYLNYKGADAYLSIYENRKYFEVMEKSELDLFDEVTAYLRMENEKSVYSIADIGSGDGLKGRIFIERLGEDKVKAYYPIDIQPIELAAALRSHKDGKYAKHPTVLDIENLGARFPLKLLPGEREIDVFFGGTYGNFPHEKINTHLRSLFAGGASTLLVSMPIVYGNKTDADIIEMYTGIQFEEMMFGPLAQVGFEKKDFEQNPINKELIVQLKIENRCLVSSVILKNSVTVLDIKFEKGTEFKMTSSWKPTPEEFRETLESAFVLDKVFNNDDMAIAVIKAVK